MFVLLTLISVYVISCDERCKGFDVLISTPLFNLYSLLKTKLGTTLLKVVNPRVESLKHE